jgi:hypothetical protein
VHYNKSDRVEATTKTLRFSSNCCFFSLTFWFD